MYIHKLFLNSTLNNLKSVFICKM